MVLIKSKFGLVQGKEQFEISYDNIGFGWGIRYRTRRRNYVCKDIEAGKFIMGLEK